jgi:LCP family protein required for cell wall assembly
MMLVSLNPATNDLGILSIPRDLYFDIPGYSVPQKVNTAMVLGELQQVNSGPTLAMQTIQYNLGMRVHNYVAVDFQAVIQIIDILGGLDIDVPYDIADYEYPDMNFGYDPLILHAGLQHMNGEIALKFARTRHGDNDFERARRQQMVIYALRDRILDANLLPQLILQSPSMLSSLDENVYTDVQLDQMIQLALYLKDIPQENIRTGVIDSNYIVPWMTNDGQSVLVPRRSQLSELLTEIFGANYSE